MSIFKKVVYNVYSKHPTDGLVLIGQGLSSANAVKLATRVFAESKWLIDTQIVPAPAAVYSASLQNSDRPKRNKKTKASYSFSSS
jgi:hypothetical protein